jgi:hypothetical protein
VLEARLRELGGDAQRRLEVAEARGEDEPRPLLSDEVAHDALGVRPFRDAFDRDRLDARAERALELAPAELVLVRPAGLADRRDVDEADDERRRLGGDSGKVRCGERRAGDEQRARAADEVLQHGCPRHGPRASMPRRARGVRR